MKNILLIVLLLAVTTLIILQFRGRNTAEPQPIVKVDTIYIEQIIKDTIPQLVYRTIKEVIVDTIYSIDSIPTPILVPLEERSYSNELVTEKEDTIAYRVNISGYKAQLNDIEIGIKYKQFNTTIIQPYKPNWKDRFNLSLQSGVGYGIINKKADVYVGVGLSCKIRL